MCTSEILFHIFVVKLIIFLMFHVSLCKHILIINVFFKDLLLFLIIILVIQNLKEQYSVSYRIYI